MAHFHEVVWIDHRTAEIYGLGRDKVSHELVKSHGPHHIHHKAGTMGSGHEHDKPTFFRETAAQLSDAGAILILGPAETKTELKAYLESHAPAVFAKVVGVEPLDRKDEGEIITFARHFFARSDRMARPKT